MKKEEIVKIQTNIDDMNPEVYGYLMEELLDLGALDVYFTPIQMKKNRPGIELSILARPDNEEEIVKQVLTETTSIGVRLSYEKRVVLDRETKTINTDIGKAEVKLAWLDGIVVNIAPEYESCRKLARDSKLSLLDVYQTIRSEAQKTYGDN